MQAILTKYIGPTNHRGSRVRAKMPSGSSVIVPWDHKLDAEENHRQAAIAAIKKNMARNIPFDITTGWTKDFMVHVVNYRFPEFES